VRNAGGVTGARAAERSGSRTMSDMPCSEHGAAVGVDTVQAQARKEHPIKNQSAPEHRSRNGGHTLCGVRAQRWPVEGTLWGGAGGQQGISRYCAKPQSASSTSDRRVHRPSERSNSFLARFNLTGAKRPAIFPGPNAECVDATPRILAPHSMDSDANNGAYRFRSPGLPNCFTTTSRALSSCPRTWYAAAMKMCQCFCFIIRASFV